ncbi:MAG: helix-turn-helix domain-containing protein, partial [Bacteroidota bacterium]
PNMDGFAFTTLLKGDEITSHIPIVLLTAKTDIKYQQQGYELGVHDYIIKPFDIVLLHTRLVNILTNQLRAGQKNKVFFIANSNTNTVQSMDEKFMQRLLKIVQKEIGAANFTVDTLASKMAVSRSVLYRKVKALTGASPAEFIRSYKLQQAKVLLQQNPSMLISDVAFELGFNDPKYFSKSFKKEYGVSPKRFLQEVQRTDFTVNTE